MSVSYETIEKFCSEAKTREEWEDLIEEYDARDIGSFVADWADNAAYHPNESAGIACINEEDFAIVASWTDDGFWDVSIETLEDAEKMIDEYNEFTYSDDYDGGDWLPEHERDDDEE